MQKGKVEQKAAVVRDRSDADLVRLAQENIEHFGLIYQKYWEPVYRFVYKRVAEEHLVADIAQEVFVKAMSAIGRYEDRGYAFSSWLFRIAISESGNAVRKRLTDRRIRAQSTDLIELMNEVYDETNDQRLELVKQAMESLKDKELQLIQLRYFEKMKLKDVAVILNMTESSCKVKMFRVMEKIRKHVRA